MDVLTAFNLIKQDKGFRDFALLMLDYSAGHRSDIGFSVTADIASSRYAPSETRNIFAVEGGGDRYGYRGFPTPGGPTSRESDLRFGDLLDSKEFKDALL